MRSLAGKKSPGSVREFSGTSSRSRHHQSLAHIWSCHLAGCALRRRHGVHAMPCLAVVTRETCKIQSSWSLLWYWSNIRGTQTKGLGTHFEFFLFVFCLFDNDQRAGKLRSTEWLVARLVHTAASPPRGFYVQKQANAMMQAYCSPTTLTRACREAYH